MQNVKLDKLVLMLNKLNDSDEAREYVRIKDRVPVWHVRTIDLSINSTSPELTELIKNVMVLMDIVLLLDTGHIRIQEYKMLADLKYVVLSISKNKTFYTGEIRLPKFLFSWHINISKLSLAHLFDIETAYKRERKNEENKKRRNCAQYKDI